MTEVWIRIGDEFKLDKTFIDQKQAIKYVIDLNMHNSGFGKQNQVFIDSFCFANDSM